MEAAAGTKEAEVTTTEDGADTGGKPSKERDMEESSPTSPTGLDVGIPAGAWIPRDATNCMKASVVTGRASSAVVVTGAKALSRPERGFCSNAGTVPTVGIDPNADEDGTTLPP